MNEPSAATSNSADNATDAKLTGFQRLVCFYQKVMLRQGLCYVASLDAIVHLALDPVTEAWMVPATSRRLLVSDFVYESVTPRAQHLEAWRLLTSTAGTAQHIIKFIKNSMDFAPRAKYVLGA